MWKKRQIPECICNLTVKFVHCSFFIVKKTTTKPLSDKKARKPGGCNRSSDYECYDDVLAQALTAFGGRFSVALIA
jgi:hypothetical protein